jgi:hypothetical protein
MDFDFGAGGRVYPGDELMVCLYMLLNGFRIPILLDMVIFLWK